MIEMSRRLIKGCHLGFLFLILFICSESASFFPQAMSNLVQSGTKNNPLLGLDNRVRGPNPIYRLSLLNISLSLNKVGDTNKEDTKISL